MKHQYRTYELIELVLKAIKDAGIKGRVADTLQRSATLTRLTCSNIIVELEEEVIGLEDFLEEE